VFHQDAYGILDARIRLGEAFGTGLDISLFGSNLTDEVYKVYALHSAPTRMVTFGEPRTYGLEFRANF
jgi:outer membrane receptor protein involved in Fe transport